MSDAVTRLNAALQGRYTLERELGQGGMATVYLADDLKHGRKVAVKVLRPELAALIGGERFLAEIRTTAALQHPHILPLFDSGEADGFLYYVMPYVDGESLRSLLNRERQLDVDQALRLAKAVASALGYAHDHDVIHRDIKPENILLHAGQPVVADFGIALAISAAGGGRLTETGLSLGTPHYMSPEQASADRDLSARSDVYSLGCVLYEMLAGQPPHTGPTAQSILVRILTEDPRPLTDMRRTVPPNVTAAVTKAIEKLPADRFKSAHEFAAALDDAGFRWEPVRTRPVAAPTPAYADAPTADTGHWDTRSKVLAGLAGLFAVLAGVQAIASGGEPAAPMDAPVVSFLLEDSAGAVEQPYLGVNGAIATVRGGVIHVRPSGSLREEPLEETSGVLNLAFSPDASWIAYTSNSGGLALRKVPTAGGPVVTLWTGEGGTLFKPAWGEDGWIYVSVFSNRPRTFRVPEVGGPDETLLELAPPMTSLDPEPLPGGGGVIVTVSTNTGQDGRLLALDLESGDTATIVNEGFSARWSPTGHLVYAHASGALFAVPFDPDALEVTGPPVPVRDGVGIFVEAVGRYDLSRSGTLAYISAPAMGGGGEFSVTLMDPAGGATTLPLEPTNHWDAELSPDGDRLAYIRNDHVWVYDLDLGNNRRLTEEGASDHHNPRWSPDGSEIAYRASREDGPGAWIVPAAGGEPRLVVEGAQLNPAQWLADGTILLTTESGNIGRTRADGAPVTWLLEADWQERVPAVSPDGRWIAYLSDETGTMSLHVRTWPELRNRILVSEAGRTVVAQSYPVWSPDGRTLYYHEGSRIVAATVDASNGFRVAERRVVSVPAQGFLLEDAHPDGRLLLLTAGDVTDGEEQQARLILVTNWQTELTRRLGRGVR